MLWVYILNNVCADPSAPVERNKDLSSLSQSSLKEDLHLITFSKAKCDQMCAEIPYVYSGETMNHSLPSATVTLLWHHAVYWLLVQAALLPSASHICHLGWHES